MLTAQAFLPLIPWNRSFNLTYAILVTRAARARPPSGAQDVLLPFLIFSYARRVPVFMAARLFEKATYCASHYNIAKSLSNGRRERTERGQSGLENIKRAKGDAEAGTGLEKRETNRTNT